MKGVFDAPPIPDPPQVVPPKRPTDFDKEDAIAEIKKMGGEVERNPVLVVDFSIAACACRMKTLSVYPPAPGIGPDPHTLNLDRTNVTDAGLKHLERLTRLEVLYLNGTRVSGPGLVHLEGMPRLVP